MHLSSASHAMGTATLRITSLGSYPRQGPTRYWAIQVTRASHCHPVRMPRDQAYTAEKRDLRLVETLTLLPETILLHQRCVRTQLCSITNAVNTKHSIR
jgi:hypothetical protein